MVTGQYLAKSAIQELIRPMSNSIQIWLNLQNSLMLQREFPSYPTKHRHIRRHQWNSIMLSSATGNVSLDESVDEQVSQKKAINWKEPLQNIGWGEKFSEFFSCNNWCWHKILFRSNRYTSFYSITFNNLYPFWRQFHSSAFSLSIRTNFNQLLVTSQDNFANVVVAWCKMWAIWRVW